MKNAVFLRRLVCMAICLLFFTSTFAQTSDFQTSFYHLSDNGEIPSTEVYSTFQDSKGNMWFCSDAGATKYDGYYYKTYTEKDGLVSNVVFNISEDSKGRIWFLTLNPHLCYLENDIIHEFQYNDIIDQANYGFFGLFSDIYVDKNDNVFYSLRGAGMIKITADGAFSQVHKNNRSSQITKIDDIYISSIRIDPYSKLDPRKELGKMIFPVFFGTIDKLKEIGECDPNSHFQIHNSKSIDNSIFVLGGQLFSKEGRIAGVDQVMHVAPDPRNKEILWVGTKRGLYKGKIRKDNFIIIESFLEDVSITSICWDNENSGWFSTLSAGVFYCNNFQVVKIASSNKSLDKLVPSVTVSNGNVFYSSKDYCYRLSSEEKFKFDYSTYGKLGNWNGNLIMSGASREFCVVDGVLRVPYMRDFTVRNNSIYGASSLVFKFDPITLKVDTLYDGTRDSSRRRKLFFRAIEILENGSVIVGGPKGVSVINDGKLNHNFLRSETLGLDVSDLLFDTKWGLIVATCNKGVYIFRNDEAPIILSEDNGLISNNVSCVSVSKDGMLLIGTNYGLNYVKPKSRQIGLLSKNLGLESQDINAICADDQYVYIATKDGLFRADLEHFYLKHSEVGINVCLERLTVNGTRQNVKGENLDLSAGVQSLIIRFRVGSYKNWFNKKYQYRLSSDEDWIDITSPEIVLYRPSGSFKVEVRYNGENNHWSQTYFLLNVDVRLPIWERWYFWLAGVIIIIAGLTLWFRRRQRKSQQELELKNELLSLEQRMHSARMNPHFIFNVLNSIQGFMMFNENEMAEKYLVKFSKLMRKVLDNSSDGQIYLNDEIEIIDKFLELEELRSNGAFKYQVQAPKYMENCLIPTMLIQPFVENAVIHGTDNQKQSGEIIVNFKKEGDNVLRVTIFNNTEIGEKQLLELANSTNSNALGITRSRLHNYSQLTGNDQYKILIEESYMNNRGTAVIVVLPILKSEK